MTKIASIKWQSNLRFEAIVDNQVISLGQINQPNYLTSQSLLLISLGSSCASELLILLKEYKLDIEKFEINIEAKKENRDNGICSFILNFIISGKSINIPNLLKSIETTIYQKSSIAVLLRKCTSIDYNVCVNGVSIEKEKYNY